MRIRSYHRFFCWVSLLALLSSLPACSKEDSNAGQKQAPNRASRSAMGLPGGMSQAAIPVAIEPVERTDIAASLLTYTTLEAERHVEVIARTQGLVKTLFVEEGDRVKAGQALAQLDEEVLALQLQEREVNLKTLQAAFERAQDLRTKELVSKGDFENTRFSYETAKTQYESAKLQLAYATIRSPIAGIVTERLIETGNLVNANQAVFKVADFDPLLARIYIPEKELGKVKLGQAVRISVEGVANRFFAGQVRMISPVVNPQSGTIKVTVEITDRSEILRPGMFATVYIITEIHHNTLAVPKKALVSEAEGTYVFLFKGGTAEKHRLQLGFAEGDRVEALTGIAAGDSIITVGQEGLRNGARVRIPGQPVAAPALAADAQGAIDERRRPAEGNRGGTPDMGGRPGDFDLEKTKARMLQNPKVKEAYDKRVKEDPEFAHDPQKQRQFFRQMFIKMRGSSPR